MELARDYDLKFEILPAKPRRPDAKSRHTINLLDGEQKDARFDTQKWDYDLIGYNNRQFFDVFFVPDAFDSQWPMDAYEHVAWLLVDGHLGEELVIEKIRYVKVVPAAEVTSRRKVELLYEHLIEVIGERKEEW